MADLKPSCFWCEHLILDGCDSWCELHIAGEVCNDYKPNEYRIKRCTELEGVNMKKKINNLVWDIEVKSATDIVFLTMDSLFVVVLIAESSRYFCQMD